MHFVFLKRRKENVASGSCKVLYAAFIGPVTVLMFGPHGWDPALLFVHLPLSRLNRSAQRVGSFQQKRCQTLDNHSKNSYIYRKLFEIILIAINHWPFQITYLFPIQQSSFLHNQQFPLKKMIRNITTTYSWKKTVIFSDLSVKESLLGIKAKLCIINPVFELQ